VATQDFVIRLLCLVDDRLGCRHKHPQARLWPSELVTLGLLFAVKGSAFRSFYRWLERDYADVYGRSPRQVGKKGDSNHRWIVGLKLCWLLNAQGEVVGWAAKTANTANQRFAQVVAPFQDRTITLADGGFAAIARPANLELCARARRTARPRTE
jgi:hypothetical protein